MRASTSSAGYATVAAFKKGTRAALDERVIVGALERLAEKGLIRIGDRPAISDALPADDAAFLDEHGGVADNRDALLSAHIETALSTHGLADQTASVAQTAVRLGLSESRVRHKILDGSLYAYPAQGRGNARRIPTWQFDDAEPVPHLAAVLAELPADLDPIEVRNFVVNARIDHGGAGTSSPLLTWLRAGGDASPALDLAREMAEVV